MPPPNENIGLTQNLDVKVDEQHDAQTDERTDNMTKTIYSLTVCRGIMKTEQLLSRNFEQLSLYTFSLTVFNITTDHIITINAEAKEKASFGPV